MTPTAIALLVTGSAGMLGFVLAYFSRGQVISRDNDLRKAATELTATKGNALEAQAARVTAEAKLADAAQYIKHLEASLDSERKSKQSLVDALTKAGIPVGNVVVGATVDRLYQDQDGRGQGANSGGSGGQKAVSLTPPPSPIAAASKR